MGNQVILWGDCTRPKACFICHQPGHHVNACPEWSKTLPGVQYLGSANRGLGFFHIQVEDDNANEWLNFTNYGVIMV